VDGTLGLEIGEYLRNFGSNKTARYLDSQLLLLI
jgi:hypothetical protein